MRQQILILCGLALCTYSACAQNSSELRKLRKQEKQNTGTTPTTRRSEEIIKTGSETDKNKNNRYKRIFDITIGPVIAFPLGTFQFGDQYFYSNADASEYYLPFSSHSTSAGIQMAASARLESLGRIDMPLYLGVYFSSNKFDLMNIDAEIVGYTLIKSLGLFIQPVLNSGDRLEISLPIIRVGLNSLYREVDYIYGSGTGFRMDFGADISYALNSRLDLKCSGLFSLNSATYGVYSGSDTDVFFNAITLGFGASFKFGRTVDY